MEKELNYLSERIEEIDSRINHVIFHKFKDWKASVDLLEKEKEHLENILSALTIVELDVSELPVLDVGEDLIVKWKSDMGVEFLGPKRYASDTDRTGDQVINDWCRYELFDGITDQEIANLIRERAATC